MYLFHMKKRGVVVGGNWGSFLSWTRFRPQKKSKGEGPSKMFLGQNKKTEQNKKKSVFCKTVFLKTAEFCRNAML